MSTGRAEGRRYLQARMPMWLRGVLMAALFGGFMFLFVGPLGDGPSWVDLLVFGVGGALFGVAMAVTFTVQLRRVFRDVPGGETAERRVAVQRAVDSAVWPADPALHPTAVELARQRLRPGQSTLLLGALFGGYFLLALYNAIFQERRWWLLVIFWAAVGPRAIMVSRRQRRSAEKLLLWMS